MNKMMGYVETAVLLQQYDITLPPYRLVANAIEAVAAADALGYPVAIKAVSPDLSHKSDRGLVKLGLETAVSVQKAVGELAAAVNWGREAALEGYLVQKMMPAGVEMIIGLHTDPQFGPVIALGSGGVLVELLDDVILRLPPITMQQAMQMIEATKSIRLLRGYRRYPPADTPALAHLLVNISRLATANVVASLDLNPVIVLPEGHGVGVVDMRAETTERKEA
jgi:succinyl-CoA synthetase beta subunit